MWLTAMLWGGRAAGGTHVGFGQSSVEGLRLVESTKAPWRHCGTELGAPSAALQLSIDVADASLMVNGSPAGRARWLLVFQPWLEQHPSGCVGACHPRAALSRFEKRSTISWVTRLFRNLQRPASISSLLEL